MSTVFQSTPAARPVPPGSILRRELDARGWEGKDLAEVINRPEQAISQIMTGKKGITPETAIQLGLALGMDPAFWLNLEKNYQLGLARRKAQDTEIGRRARLRELVPNWREVTRLGWLPQNDDLGMLERAVCALLKIPTLDAEPAMALSRRHGREDSAARRRLQLVWARRVEAIAEAKDLPPFGRKALRGAIKELLQHARTPEAVAAVPPILEDLGIAFVIVPRLEKTLLEGAAWTTIPNPIVALTLRHDRIDNFWFNLLHELGHILAGHKGIHLDSEGKDGDGASSTEEQEANEFAAALLGRERVARLWEQSRPSPSRREVLALAEELGLHPGIVVGQLHAVSGDFRYHKALQVKIRQHLIPWTDSARN